jgi:cobalamin-dependent methionine synthase I
MTDTVLSSATREVVIGPERPFVVIGERINLTGRKALAGIDPRCKRWMRLCRSRA